MRPLVARHVQDVAEAARRDHPDLGAGALDHHVGGDSRSVKDGIDRGGRHTGELADPEDALHHAFRLVLRRARHLRHDDLLASAVARTLQDDVRERSADVDADPDHAGRLCRDRRKPARRLGRMPGTAQRRPLKLTAGSLINPFALTPLIGAFFNWYKY